MGNYYVASNSAKREYIRLETFGDETGSAVPLLREGSYFHAIAVTYLCTSYNGFKDGFQGRWQCDPVDFVGSNSEEQFMPIVETYTDISLSVMDWLCDEGLPIIEELVRRATPGSGYPFMTVSEALLTLIDDSQYKHFRREGASYFGDRWEEIVEGMRKRVAAYEAMLKPTHAPKA